LALEELRAQHVEQRLDLEVVVRVERACQRGAIDRDRGLRALEVVPLRDLFGRLVDGVVDFLEVRSSGNIERRKASHGENIRVRGARCAVTSEDRKSTRLNSSHRTISYAVFCLKKKKKKKYIT